MDASSTIDESAGGHVNYNATGISMPGAGRGGGGGGGSHSAVGVACSSSGTAVRGPLGPSNYHANDNYTAEIYPDERHRGTVRTSSRGQQQQQQQRGAGVILLSPLVHNGWKLPPFLLTDGDERFLFDLEVKNDALSLLG
jgi:hypothetical protein